MNSTPPIVLTSVVVITRVPEIPRKNIIDPSSVSEEPKSLGTVMAVKIIKYEALAYVTSKYQIACD